MTNSVIEEVTDIIYKQVFIHLDDKPVLNNLLQRVYDAGAASVLRTPSVKQPKPVGLDEAVKKILDIEYFEEVFDYADLNDINWSDYHGFKDCEEKIKAILQAYGESLKPQWQPISTAPKGYTIEGGFSYVLFRGWSKTNCKHVLISGYMDSDRKPVYFYNYKLQITHWMPLPVPPNSSASAESAPPASEGGV